MLTIYEKIENKGILLVFLVEIRMVGHNHEENLVFIINLQRDLEIYLFLNYALTNRKNEKMTQHFKTVYFEQLCV